jgi:hypothetical protein
MVYAGQRYEEGWLVVPAQWYALRQKSERGYELLPEKVWILVNAIIRLKGLAFRANQSGPQQRQLRSNATGPYGMQRTRGPGLSFLDEDTHNRILACCEFGDPVGDSV